jgi:CubicO group peptidase (beta-lactamase class C family)
MLPLLLAAVLQGAPASPAPTSVPSPPAAASARAALPPGTIAIAQMRIEAAMARLGVPGVAVAVVAREQLVWSAAFGEADVENDVPVRTDTMFRLASVSKPITATAVLQLAERGRLDLDAPVQRYVPAFPEKPWTVTPRLLLAHLGGVRHYAEGEFGSTRRYGSATEALQIFAGDALAHEPGTRFLYTSYGYNLLGCAVEGASGQSFLDYVRANVFEPAGMFSARDDDVLAVIPHRAQGYAKSASGALRNSALADTSNKIPGGGLCATVEDVARFAMALQGGVLLTRESLGRMLTRQKTKDGKPVGYGLGFFLTERDGVKEAWHTGGQQRVSNVLYLQPDRRIGVILLTNLEGIGPQLTDLAREIATVVTR